MPAAAPGKIDGGHVTTIYDKLEVLCNTSDGTDHQACRLAGFQFHAETLAAGDCASAVR